MSIWKIPTLHSYDKSIFQDTVHCLSWEVLNKYPKIFLKQIPNISENIAQKSEMILDSVVLTSPPAVDLSLQPGDGVFQRLVLLLLFLPLVLPLLGRQLHIQTHCVLDRLCPGETGR